MSDLTTGRLRELLTQAETKEAEARRRHEDARADVAIAEVHGAADAAELATAEQDAADDLRLAAAHVVRLRSALDRLERAETTAAEERARTLRELRAREAMVALHRCAANLNARVAQLETWGEGLLADWADVEAFLASVPEVPGAVLITELHNRMRAAIGTAIPRGWLPPFRPEFPAVDRPGLRFHREVEAELRKAGVVGRPDFPQAAARRAAEHDHDTQEEAASPCPPNGSPPRSAASSRNRSASPRPPARPRRPAPWSSWCRMARRTPPSSGRFAPRHRPPSATPTCSGADAADHSSAAAPSPAAA